jgi:hypothetical protein
MDVLFHTHNHDDELTSLPMKPGTSMSFRLNGFHINNYQKEGGRSGYELFLKRRK